jgi:hypothetical protein
MRRGGTRKPKKDITLMTLLSQEATKDSRDLLKKYNIPDAKNYADLEQKLADLYYKSTDKIGIEKDLAQIHPHKNWLLKRLVEEKKEQEPKEVVQKEIISEQTTQQPNITCCGNPYCPAHGCMGMGMGMGRYRGGYSYIDDMPIPPTPSLRPEESKKGIDLKDYIGFAGVVAIIGMAFYVVTKANK